ncbi:MFS transporter [Mammaliicoccus sciuri]|uniref:MFS transporter n=1 Tax=Mammaliicoccus sciuri TaxID=1296 RepID=UPI003F578E5D
MGNTFIGEFSNLSRIIKLKLICSFFNKTAMRTIIPFMALFFSSIIGNVQTGILLAVNLIVQILSTFIGGYLSDLYNPKKVIIVGQTLNAISFIGMTFFISNTFFNEYGIIFFFLLSSLIGNIHKAPLDSIILEDVNKNNKRFVYTIDYWIANISLSLGMLIGSIFYKNHIFELFFCLSIVLIVTTILYQYVVLKGYTPKIIHKDKNNINLFSEYIQVLKDKNWNIYVLGGTLIIFAELTLSNYTAVNLKDNFNPVYLMNYKLDGVSIYSFLIIINTVIAALFSFMVEKYSRILGDRWCLIIGIILNCISYSLLAFLQQWMLLLFFIIIATIGELLYSPVRQSLQYYLIPSNKRSMYISIGYLSIQIGNILASLSISIGDYVGEFGVPIVIIIFGLSGLFLTLLSVKKVQL